LVRLGGKLCAVSFLGHVQFLSGCIRGWEHVVSFGYNLETEVPHSRYGFLWMRIINNGKTEGSSMMFLLLNRMSF